MGLEWNDKSERDYRGLGGKPPNFGPGFVGMVLLLAVIVFIVLYSKQ
jgi:hypothetical protein